MFVGAFQVGRDPHLWCYGSESKVACAIAARAIPVPYLLTLGYADAFFNAGDTL